MKFEILWCLLVVASRSDAGQWRWPDSAPESSVRIDTKIAFDDKDLSNKVHHSVRQDDDVFHEPSETEGFYNRPPGSGRYPVRIEGHRNQAYRVDGHAIHPLRNEQKPYSSNYEGNVDSLQFCKCINTPECNPQPNSEAACGVGRYLCCFKRPNKVPLQNTEFFNEVEDERPMLLPGRENLARPFPPPPGSEITGFFGPFNPGHDNSLGNAVNKQPSVLVGPGGPTGNVGPSKPDVLVGPGGPTGIIGPGPVKDDIRQMVFNIPEEEDSILSPGQENLARPFPPPNLSQYQGFFSLFGSGKDNSLIGIFDKHQQGILVGPDLPNGAVGPQVKHDVHTIDNMGRNRRDSASLPTFESAGGQRFYFDLDN